MKNLSILSLLLLLSACGTMNSVWEGGKTVVTGTVDAVVQGTSTVVSAVAEDVVDTVHEPLDGEGLSGNLVIEDTSSIDPQEVIDSIKETFTFF